MTTTEFKPSEQMRKSVLAGADAALSFPTIAAALGITTKQLHQHFEAELNEGVHRAARRYCDGIVIIAHAAKNGHMPSINTMLAGHDRDLKRRIRQMRGK